MMSGRFYVIRGNFYVMVPIFYVIQVSLTDKANQNELVSSIPSMPLVQTTVQAQ
jgi:hypothetical protein